MLWTVLPCGPDVPGNPADGHMEEGHGKKGVHEEGCIYEIKNVYTFVLRVEECTVWLAL